MTTANPASRNGHNRELLESLFFECLVVAGANGMAAADSTGPAAIVIRFLDYWAVFDGRPESCFPIALFAEKRMAVSEAKKRPGRTVMQVREWLKTCRLSEIAAVAA